MAFERAHPDCAVSLQEVALADSYGPLQSGEIDVLVCWLVLDDPGLTIGPEIARYPRALAVAIDHPLAREQSVSVEVLADYPVPNWDYHGLANRVPGSDGGVADPVPDAPSKCTMQPFEPLVKRPASSPAARSWSPP